jgi:hypothetical protein
MKNLSKKVIRIITPIMIGLVGMSCAQEVSQKSQDQINFEKDYLFPTMIEEGFGEGDHVITRDEYMRNYTKLTETRRDSEGKIFDDMDNDNDGNLDFWDGYSIPLKKIKIFYE